MTSDLLLVCILSSSLDNQTPIHDDYQPINPKAIHRHTRFDLLGEQVTKFNGAGSILRKKEFLRQLLNQSMELEGAGEEKGDALLDIIEQYIRSQLKLSTVSLLSLRFIHIRTDIYIHNFRSQQRMQRFHSWSSCLISRWTIIDRLLDAQRIRWRYS